MRDGKAGTFQIGAVDEQSAWSRRRGRALTKSPAQWPNASNLVLVKDQSSPAQNGVYVVGASPARAVAFDTYDEHSGSIIVVEEGTTNADTLWLCTSNIGGTLNTTAISYNQLILTGTVPTTRTITAGAGLTGGGDLSANRTLAVDLGKASIWVPANAMVPRTTNGAAAGAVETFSNKNMLSTLDFDASTQEFAQFDIRMPKSWNEGTVTFIPVWSHAGDDDQLRRRLGPRCRGDLG